MIVTYLSIMKVVTVMWMIIVADVEMRYPGPSAKVDSLSSCGECGQRPRALQPGRGNTHPGHPVPEKWVRQAWPFGSDVVNMMDTSGSKV